jgi:hypothetical protein
VDPIEKDFEAIRTIIKCIEAFSFKNVDFNYFKNMVEYWTITNKKGNMQLWVKFKDGVKLRLDKNLNKLRTYLALKNLRLDGLEKLDRNKLYLMLKDLAKDKFKSYSLDDSLDDPIDLTELLRRIIVDLRENRNYDVFCTCNAVPPSLYVRKRYFMNRIAPYVARKLKIPIKSVPSVFKEWGLLLRSEPVVIKVPKCIKDMGPGENGIIADRYYEVNVEKLSEITQVKNICTQEKTGDENEQ